jgi:hypothetical protein
MSRIAKVCIKLILQFVLTSMFGAKTMLKLKGNSTENVIDRNKEISWWPEPQSMLYINSLNAQPLSPNYFVKYSIHMGRKITGYL